MICPASGRDETADVVVENGRVSRLGRDAARDAEPGDHTRVVDASGLWVLPGFVDLHAHLREPGQEYKEDVRSGLAAAAAGGFTTVLAMPNTRPAIDNRATVESVKARAREAGGPTLIPVGAVTLGREGKHLTEMFDMRDGGVRMVSDDGACVMSPAVMRRALEYARNADLVVCQHCEDTSLTEGAQMHEGRISTQLGLRGWPRVAEDIIVARDLLLAEYTGARYHVAHVSSLGAVRLLREAKSRGLPVTAEVTPHHLMLTDARLLGYDTACKVNPPLREEEDRQALLDALVDGTIDCIATDHAPHSSLEKDSEFAEADKGMIGLETALPVLLDLVRAERIGLPRLVAALTWSAASVIGLEAGALREGSRADVTVVDPTARWTVTPSALRSKSSNTPWLGSELTGVVRMTIAGGVVVHERAT